MKNRVPITKTLVYRILFLFSFAIIISVIFVQYRSLEQKKFQIFSLSQNELALERQIASISADLKTVTSEDQYVKNKKQEEEIKLISLTYKKTVKVYEDLLKLKEAGGETEKLDGLISQSLTYLSDKNYASAEAVLTTLANDIKKEQDALAQKAASFTIPANIVTNNTPPGSGYSRQKVQTEIGDFLVDIISADLNSTKVIIDTASDGTCANDCPVLSLADYVSRSGAYAGINGSYFCPASYPSCAGKTNSFDTLLMNKNKIYFNSDNNVYSTVPVAVFGNGWARFIGRSSDWGRDTSVDGVIANQPLLLSGGNIVFGGDGDPKKGSKGARSFVGNKGSTVYIGVTHNATVAENAYVLKALGLENALNLDSGGSTALWSGGYKVGPGRTIPNAVLFVRK